MEVATLSSAGRWCWNEPARTCECRRRHATTSRSGSSRPRARHPEVYPELRAWVALASGRVVGAAIRTPPHNLVLAQPTDERALAALAHAIDDELPGVVGADPGGGPLRSGLDGTAWSCGRASMFDQRIYAADRRGDTDTYPRVDAPGDRCRPRRWSLVWFRAFSDGSAPSRRQRRSECSSGGSMRGSGPRTRASRSGSATGDGCRSRASAGRHRTAFASARSTRHPSSAARGYGTAVTAGDFTTVARQGTPLLFPLHRPGEPDVERDLHADRLRAGLRLARGRFVA